jgi:hypothetical protein
MSTGEFGFVRASTLAGAALLLASAGLRAGDVYHAARQPTTRPATPIVRAVPQTEAVAIKVEPGRPASSEPAVVQLRGPDGQVRSFALEGGREAIKYTGVVLRAGQSLTIHVASAK